MSTRRQAQDAVPGDQAADVHVQPPCKDTCHALFTHVFARMPQGHMHAMLHVTHIFGLALSGGHTSHGILTSEPSSSSPACPSQDKLNGLHVLA